VFPTYIFYLSLVSDNVITTQYFRKEPGDCGRLLQGIEEGDRRIGLMVGVKWASSKSNDLQR
jgi:hypothetical protein